MYVYRNIQAYSPNHCCCSGKAVSIIYSGRVFVDLGMQLAIRMRRIVICHLAGSTIFFFAHLINGTIFGKKSLKTKCVF